MRWAGHTAHIGVMRNAYTIFWLENREGNKTTWKTSHRWEDNIRIDLRKIGWKDVDWIHVTQDRDQ
jgi:hypothetical protein